MTVQKNRIIVGASIGTALAGLTALLYAIKGGKQLRKEISIKTGDMLGEAGSYISKAKDKTLDLFSQSTRNAAGFYNSGKDMLKTKAAKLRKAAKAGVSAYKNNRHSSRTISQKKRTKKAS